MINDIPKTDSSNDMKQSEFIYSKKLADKFLGNIVNSDSSINKSFDDVMQLLEKRIRDDCNIKINNAEKNIREESNIIVQNIEKKIREECVVRVENIEREYKQKIESLSIEDDKMLLLKLNQFIQAEKYTIQTTGGSEITFETLNDSKIRLEVLRFIYSKLFEGANLEYVGSDKYINMSNLQFLKMIFYLMNQIDTSSFTFK